MIKIVEGWEFWLDGWQEYEYYEVFFTDFDYALDVFKEYLIDMGTILRGGDIIHFHRFFSVHADNEEEYKRVVALLDNGNTLASNV